ncbi:SRPBCC family protein [Streptosporangium canum]|uniref:Polyketide cyclase / dehydrase and lipid transport n=1 Tax=Streptosporangium canum TaxID=324952 RepID=A0A1I3Y5T8_9ACTN|nr:SRPBCC family protein [Streptosporangium canum]SFK27113.1 Polyketide cyclase / dehydrase and lipid transport [Streptosporangium canum]
MSTIEQSVDVNVPIRTAYNQWTQFESFPEFMEGVESVKQLSDTRTAWVVEIAGVRREFEADITEQHPDERVAWKSVERPHQAGVVTFHHLNPETTRVTLQMEYDPEGFVETVGDWLQIVRLRVRGDLERFKTFIESRGGETGAWRGDVPGPQDRGTGDYGPGAGGGGLNLEDRPTGGPAGGYGFDEPAPPRTVGGGGYPPESPLPPPGSGPLPPAGRRPGEEPPMAPGPRI